MIDMEKAVKFCTAALEAAMHGKATFKCPLCGATARIQPYHRKTRAQCRNCNRHIDW